MAIIIVGPESVPVDDYCRPRKRDCQCGHCRPRTRACQWPLLTTIVCQRCLSIDVVVSNTVWYFGQWRDTNRIKGYMMYERPSTLDSSTIDRTLPLQHTRKSDYQWMLLTTIGWLRCRSIDVVREQYIFGNGHNVPSLKQWFGKVVHRWLLPWTLYVGQATAIDYL